MRKLDIDAISLGRSAGGNSFENYERLFHSNEKCPSVVYMTTEHFANHAFFELEDKMSQVKLIVLDKVHKMFDRNSNFRSSYEILKGIKKTFSDVPVMALTATLAEINIQKLCQGLNNPYLIKGTINRKNIKFNIITNNMQRKKKVTKEQNSSDKEKGIWDA